MFKLNTIFNLAKAESDKSQGTSSPSPNNMIKATKNWYEERADKLIVERNILLSLSILLIIIIIISIISIVYVVNSREFSPFVIQIDNNTGVATIVNPTSLKVLGGNEALSKYFIKQYISARETYNSVDFASKARQTIRLFSATPIYYTYLSYIRDKETDPILKYGQNNSTRLVIKSWSKLEANKYIVRFSINEESGSKNIFNKIAVVSFGYIPMELTDSERDINPVGFQINGYRVDDDNS